MTELLGFFFFKAYRSGWKLELWFVITLNLWKFSVPWKAIILEVFVQYFHFLNAIPPSYISLWNSAHMLTPTTQWQQPHIEGSPLRLPLLVKLSVYAQFFTTFYSLSIMVFKIVILLDFNCNTADKLCGLVIGNWTLKLVKIFSKCCKQCTLLGVLMFYSRYRSAIYEPYNDDISCHNINTLAIPSQNWDILSKFNGALSDSRFTPRAH